MPDPTLAAVIINYDGGSDLAACVASLRGQGLEAVIVVDNGSTDGSPEMIAGEPDVALVHAPRNLGFAGGANLGASQSNADAVLFLNPDIVLEKGCVAALRRGLAERGGAVAPVLAVEASQRTERGASLNRLGMPIGLIETRPPLYLQGCAVAIARNAFDAVRGFDDRYFLFVEDVEICWRLLIAGFEVSVADGARAVHRGGGSAPGGYLREGERYQTSAMRVALRERNTIACFLVCATVRRCLWTIPMIVGRTCGELGYALVSRQWTLARGLISALTWNVGHITSTIRRRHDLRPTDGGRIDRRAPLRRMVRVPLFMRALRDHGLPDVDQSH